MQIESLGGKTFKIKTKTMTIVIDPAEFCRSQTADIVIGDGKKVKGPVKRDEVFAIDRPGEYEIGGVEIKTMFADREVIAVIYAEGMTLVYLGSVEGLGEKEAASLSAVEVLIAPVEISKKLVDKLSPLALIPMGYEDKSELDKFVEEVGFADVKRQDKLNLKQSELPEVGQVVIID